MQLRSGYKIIYINNSERLLYKNFALYDTQYKKICNIPTLRKNKFFSYFRFTNRLFRLEPRCCCKLSEKQFVFSLCKKVFCVNLGTNDIFEVGNQSNGFGTPLNFCSTEEGIYWGDYGANLNYQEVNIYQIDSQLVKRVAYAFPPKSVRHIHNIIFDSVNNFFWILTGDNEVGAGIYIADKSWEKIVPFKTGEQKYRAVAGFPHKGGLIYATDSVEKTNYIYRITLDGKEEKLAEINGSCIYGIELKDYYIFSTTVESPEKSGIMALLSTDLAAGIKSKDVHLISISKKKSFH